MSMSSLYLSMNGFSSFLLSIDNWDVSTSSPDLQSFSFLKQFIITSSDQSVDKLSAHILKDFLMISLVISFHASMIQLTITRCGGGFKFPASFSCLIPSSTSHLLYCSVANDLNGLFQLTFGA